MSLLNILHFPNTQLKQPAQPVDIIDESIQNLIDDLFETMYEDNGIGLAATQVGILKRVLTIDIREKNSPALALINPVIVEQSGTQLSLEGCLSIPNIFAKVQRAMEVTVQALNPEGQTITITAKGLLSTCLQHEIDHLNGVLFIDHLSRLKRSRIINKIKKLRKKSL